MKCWSFSENRLLGVLSTFQAFQTGQELTHLPLDKMVTILQMMFSDAFSLMKNFVFYLNVIEVCS